MLANTEGNVASRRRVALKNVARRDDRLGGAGQVRRAANDPRHAGSDCVQRFRAGHSRGDSLRIRLERRQIRIPVFRQTPFLHLAPSLRQFGIGIRVGIEGRLPLFRQGAATSFGTFGHVGSHFGGHVEMFVGVPTVTLFRQADLVFAQRLAVCLGLASPVGASVSDLCLDDDQRGAIRLGSCCLERRVNLVEIVAVFHGQDEPSIRDEPRPDVLGERDVRTAVDGNLIAVVQPDEVAQPEVACHGRCFARYAFHHVAVAAHRVDRVVRDRVVLAVEVGFHPALSDGHSDGVARALAKRSGGRLDAG